MLDTKLTPIAPLAALPTAAMRLDHKSRVIDWNPACQRLLGFRKIRNIKYQNTSMATRPQSRC